MKSALDVHLDLLDRGVPHEVVPLWRPISSADQLPEVLDLDACAAVRCYVTDGALSAVLVLAGATPDPAVLRELLGAHRPATTDEINAGTDYAAGLVSPVCLPEDMPVLADSALGRYEVLYTAAGEGRLALGIRTRDLLVACGARVASLSPPPPAHGADVTDRIDVPRHLFLVRRPAG